MCPVIDLSSLPDDRRELARWLAAREEEIASRVRAALAKIIDDAVSAFTSTITASAGDLGSLDRIPDAWLTVVRTELVDDFGDLFQAGQVTAWLGLQVEPSVSFARHFEAVTNENALSYLAGATNRLAGAGETTWQLVRKQIETAMAKGYTIPELRDKVAEVGRFATSRAEVIARTETIGAYVQGDMAGQRALGDKGPVEKVWRATSDTRTRPSHAAASGQVRKMDEPFDVGGVAMDSPHAPGAPAGEVVQCRCYVEFLYPGDPRPDGTTAEPVETAPAEVTAPEPATAVTTPALEEGRPAPSPDELPSSAFEFANQKVRDKFGPIAAQLDDLHRIEPGVLPPARVVTGKATAKGGHFTPGKRSPKPARRAGMDRDTYLRKMQAWRDETPMPEIRVNDRGDGTEILSFLHEFGHRADYHSHRFTVSFHSGRGGSAAVDAFMEAARRSTPIVDAYKNWGDFGFVQYYRSPHEIWARAYSQWAANMLGGEARLALEASRAASKGKNALYQWTDDEFAELAPLVEGVLRERGLM